MMEDNVGENDIDKDKKKIIINNKVPQKDMMDF